MIHSSANAFCACCDAIFAVDMTSGTPWNRSSLFQTGPIRCSVAAGKAAWSILVAPKPMSTKRRGWDAWTVTKFPVVALKNRHRRRNATVESRIGGSNVPCEKLKCRVAGAVIELHRLVRQDRWAATDQATKYIRHRTKYLGSSASPGQSN